MMPLCKWHNSTARNGVAFTQRETRMLRLRGYMEGDSGTTFMMRYENANQYTVLYRDEENGGWSFRAIEGGEKVDPERELLSRTMNDGHALEFAIFEKRDQRFFLVSAQLAA